MKRLQTLLPLFVCVFVLAAWPSRGHAQTAAANSLSGVVTDPSGALVPGATVVLRGPAGEQTSAADEVGKYSFSPLRPGKYSVRVSVTGFVPNEREVDVSGPTVVNVELAIHMEAQTVNVEDQKNGVGTDPSSNAGAMVLGDKELQALSDDPDELEQQLQAMAGPGAGPNGGQIYVDGFSGGKLPAKSSIREVRINSNPFSPEYDRPGFGRIEIFTKPGNDSIRGQAFFQFNNESLNSRSPLLAQSDRPPYQQKFFGLDLSGPLKRQKASFGISFERRSIDENAFILATTLDSSLNPQTVNQAVQTPQTRTTISPRIDYSINAANTLTVRYQESRIGFDNQGIGNYSLESRAYDQRESEHNLQVTETAVLSPTAINESRFQFLHTNLSNTGDNSTPAISVVGAFEGGGAQVGDSGTRANQWEFTNTSTLTRNTHTIKWGGRLRQSLTADTSVTNFGGTYTFFGGLGPELDANDQAIPGSSVQLSALEVYRRTLLFQNVGYTAEQIRLLGGGASQFSLNAGIPTTSLNQFDVGLFVNDDWRVRPNLTLSYGLRYETQTNIHDWTDLAPRLGIAWAIDGGGSKTAKTVLRAGFGTFYDRIANTTTLQALRYNGTTQQSYLILNPNFFPAIPTGDQLGGAAQSQQLQIVDSGIKAPRTYQASIGLERQINSHARISAFYVANRGVHLQRTRNINAPIDGSYPYGDQDIRLLTESTGFSRSNQLIVSPNVSFKKIFLFGFYGLSYGKTDAEGSPADPYNLRAEWGPSSFADVRHRFLLGASLPLPWKLTVNPFLVISSGSPYNITTGRDTNHDGFTNERPALITGLSAADCAGGSLLYESGFGCYDLNPGAGTSVIERNYGRGPATVNLNMRLSRTWSFGNKGESGIAGGGPPPGMGGVRGASGPPPGGGGPPPGGGPGGGGPGAGMFGGASGRKYNLTLSLSASNILNHPNYATPGGDLSSSYFGEYRSLTGFGPFGAPSTYNRKIDIQLRFTF